MKPNAASALWQSVLKFQADKINPWIALRNTVGLTLPLAVAAALQCPGRTRHEHGSVERLFPR